MIVLDPESLGDKLADVRRTIHDLMAHQFVLVDGARRGRAVRTLDNPRLREFVAAYFDMAGFDLRLSEQEGWYGIIPRVDEVSAARMTQLQTLALLSLALHWQQCIDAGEVDERANAVTTLNDFCMEFEDRLKACNGPAVPTARVVEMLRGEFGSKGIVALGDIDRETDNCEMRIRPFVRHLAGEDVLVRLARHLDRRDAEAKSKAAAEEEEWNEAAPTADETD